LPLQGREGEEWISYAREGGGLTGGGGKDEDAHGEGLVHGLVRGEGALLELLVPVGPEQLAPAVPPVEVEEGSQVASLEGRERQ